MDVDVLVEFRAGRMVFADSRLSADPRKGLLRLRFDESGLKRFQWAERGEDGRASGEPELDLVVALPGEALFEKIDRPGARIFTLKFPGDKSRQQLFFWAQEPSDEQDSDFVATVNAFLNDVDDGYEGDDMEGVGEEQEDAAALAAALRSAGGAAGAASSGGGGPIGAGLLAAALGSIMGGMAGAGGGAAAGGAAAGGAPAALQAMLRAQMAEQPSLSEVLRPEVVGPMLEGRPGLAERLAPHLPEAYRSPAAIRELISTPQFRHQVALLSQALLSGELDPSQFGLPAGGPGVAEFLKAIQAQADQRRQQQGGGGGGDGHGQQQGGSS